MMDGRPIKVDVAAERRGGGGGDRRGGGGGGGRGGGFRGGRGRGGGGRFDPAAAERKGMITNFEGTKKQL